MIDERHAPSEGADQALGNRAEHESGHGAREGNAHGDTAASAIAVGEQGGLGGQSGKAEPHPDQDADGGDHEGKGGGVSAQEEARRGGPQTSHDHETRIAPSDQPARHRTQRGGGDPDIGQGRRDGRAWGLKLGEERGEEEHVGVGEARDEEHGGEGEPETGIR